MWSCGRGFKERDGICCLRLVPNSESQVACTAIDCARRTCATRSASESPPPLVLGSYSLGLVWRESVALRPHISSFLRRSTRQLRRRGLHFPLFVERDDAVDVAGSGL